MIFTGFLFVGMSAVFLCVASLLSFWLLLMSAILVDAEHEAEVLFFYAGIIVVGVIVKW